MKLRALVLLVAALSLAACKDGTGPEAIAGVYSLRSYDGNKLPLLLGTDSLGVRYEITAEYLSLAGDGVVIQTQTQRATYRSQSQIDSASRTGTWTATGSEVRMTFPDDGSVYAGALQGSTLTVTIGTSKLIYVR